MNGYRGSLLRFDETDQLVWEEDGLLVLDGARIAAVGAFQSVISSFPHLAVTSVGSGVIAPGFVDMHVHYPQIDIIASPASGLLPWLTQYTFPEEAKFANFEHAQQTADFFVQALLQNGVTSALCFATSHPNSVNALFASAKLQGMALITGLCLMDQHAPSQILSAPQAIQQSQDLLEKWHQPSASSRLGYAITPRFVPSCSSSLLHGAGELARAYPQAWIQSHVAENKDEIAWVHALYPLARSYAAVYEQFGLLRPRAVYAHGLYLDDADRWLFADREAAIAVSPTSNLFLGSGFFDFSAAQMTQMRHGLASDVGGGTSLSPFVTMRAAYFVGQEGHSKTAVSLSPSHLWWLHTLGAAKALGLSDQIGNLKAGHFADFLVLDPFATPLLARRYARAQSTSERLFAMMMLGDDRLVAKTYVAGRQVSDRETDDNPSAQGAKLG